MRYSDNLYDVRDGKEEDRQGSRKRSFSCAATAIIDSWTSGTNPHEIAYLTPGTYTLTEATAPSGYEVAENVSFSVADNGQVQHVTIVTTIITAAGAIVLAWGVFEFASAYQSRDTAQQTDSLKKVVAGILMCLAPTIINLLK